MKAVKIFLIGILAIALSVTTGFGGEKKKVAVLFPGVVSDQSWNQFGYEGLKRAEKECGVEIAYSERVSQDTQLEVFRNYAAQGYDMIIGMGGGDKFNPDYQLGEGCLVDQLVGQFMAHVCGLGYLVEPNHVKTTLQSIMKFNYREKLQNKG